MSLSNSSNSDKKNNIMKKNLFQINKKHRFKLIKIYKILKHTLIFIYNSR